MRRARARRPRPASAPARERTGHPRRPRPRPGRGGPEREALAGTHWQAGGRPLRPRCRRRGRGDRDLLGDADAPEGIDARPPPQGGRALGRRWASPENPRRSDLAPAELEPITEVDSLEDRRHFVEAVAARQADYEREEVDLRRRDYAAGSHALTSSASRRNSPGAQLLGADVAHAAELDEAGRRACSVSEPGELERVHERLPTMSLSSLRQAPSRSRSAPHARVRRNATSA